MPPPPRSAVSKPSYDSLDIDITRNELGALEMTRAETIIPLAKKQDLKRLGEPRVLTAP